MTFADAIFPKFFFGSGVQICLDFGVCILNVIKYGSALLSRSLFNLNLVYEISRENTEARRIPCVRGGLTRWKIMLDSGD